MMNDQKAAAFEEDATLTDAELENEEFVSRPDESQDRAMHVENNNSPQLESSGAGAAQIVKTQIDEQCSVVPPQDSGGTDMKDEDGKQCAVDPSVTIAAKTKTADTNFDADSLDLNCSTKHVISSHRQDKNREFDCARTGKELAAVNSETKEDILNNRMELPVSNGIKNEDPKTCSPDMNLVSKDEIRDEEQNNASTQMELLLCNEREKKELINNVQGDQIKDEKLKMELDVQRDFDVKTPSRSFLLEPNAVGNESGTKDEQSAFYKELETFHKENCLEFKPPRFYGEPLNLLKLWRAVIKLGGYEQVTSCKLWRQVGESFKPPKTCTTVSWTFRCFYEKALLEYEKYKMRSGELPFTDTSSEPANVGNQVGLDQAPGSGRARRDAAARAMQGWHSQRLLGNGEVGDPIIKDKNSTSTPKREKQLTSIGLLKRKRASPVDRAVKVARTKASKPQLDTMVVDIGSPADWVKINVHKTKDCFEVYALVPGLLREEVRVQSDPAGRLVISGQPEDVDNLWGVTPFKKVVSLPSRIDPHQTSAVVTLHGQLFVRVPFEQSDP